MPKHSFNREQGFTLVELLIAMTISGLIISALAIGFITTMRGTASAHDRFVASNGNHTLSTYFVSDVQSANTTMVSTDPTSGSGCATTEAPTTNLVRLQWWEQPTLTKMTAFSVSYRTRQVGSRWELVRYACSGSQDPYTPAPQLKDVAVAILATATPTSQVMVSELFSDNLAGPSSSSKPTTATDTGREVTLRAYAAVAEGETEPYAYTVSAALRTLSGGTTTTTSSTSTSTTTSSTTTTTTTTPAAAASLSFVSCILSDGTSVSCSGPIDIANGQWVDISVRLLDASGNAVNATSDVTVAVSSDNASKFAVTGAPVTIPAGTSQSSGPFRVTHSSPGGNATIEATSGSLASATVAVK
jgi:prepilin-type N-terminal cleavage/methylation domain-containing protein